MSLDPAALARASTPRAMRASASATGKPPVVDTNSNRSQILGSEKSISGDNGQITSAGEACARASNGTIERRCKFCRRWSTLPLMADGVMVRAEVCAEHAVIELRAILAVHYTADDDPRPLELRFAPTHCRTVDGTSYSRRSLLQAIDARGDLIPAPSIPDVPFASDARVRWEPIHTGGTPHDH